MSKKRIIAVIAAVIFAAVTVFVIYDLTAGKRVDSAENGNFAMGSYISVKVYGANADEISKTAIKAVQDADELISANIEDSDIALLNKNGNAEVSDFTKSVVDKALEVGKAGGGALDITVGALSRLWNIGNGGEKVPEEADIEEALSFCGAEKLTVNGNKMSIEDGTLIDLGAVGKGAGADEAYKVVNASEDIIGAVISVGGTVCVAGENPDGGTWKVGIRTPEPDSNGYFASLTLGGGTFISTSGSYERFFEADGRLYHHILSTQTGYPSESGLKSVTVVCDNGAYADALSTACFVLGYEKSLPLLERYSAEGVFVTGDNKVSVTDGLKDRITVSDGAYHYE